MSGFVILFLTCIALSAFFAGAEMAFVSASRLKFRELADGGDPAAQKILRLLEKPQAFLTANLVGINIVHIAAAAVLTYVLEERFGLTSEWVVTALMAPILIVLGETVPKDYGRLRSQSFLLQYASPLNFYRALMKWPVALILTSVNTLLGRFQSQVPKNIFVSPEEFRSLIEEGTRTGVLNPEEQKLIHTVMDFERTQVEAVMIPLHKVAQVNLTATVGEVKDLARRTKNKMVLVYEEIPSLIVGMVYVFDLLFEADDAQGLKKFLRSPIFLPRTTSNEKAFLTLQQRRQSFAVVTDERRDAVGAVPIERLLVL